MTNIYGGYGPDEMPTAPQPTGRPGTGASGDGGPGDRVGGAGFGIGRFGIGRFGGGSGSSRRGSGQRRWAAVLAVAAVVAGGGAFAAAEAATSSAASPAALTAASSSQGSNTPKSAASAPARKIWPRGAVARVRRLGGMYGQFTYETKQGARTVAFERGTIESVSGDAVVIRARNGMTEAWTLTGDSVVRENGKRAAVSELASGELVLAGGPVSAGAHDIRLIVIRKAASGPSA